MESGLLNGFQDDHFDDNYVEYDTRYWSIDNNSLSLELTETLSGILPMSPTEVNDHYFENDMSTTLFFNENYNNYENDYSKNLETAAYSVIDNTGITSPVVEVISVDPNCNDYDLDETDSEDDDDFIEVKSKNYESDIEIKLTNNIEDDDDGDNNDNDNYYRNRTESSSIGDYESYSSDSDDDDVDDTENDNENYEEKEINNDNKNLNYNNDIKINNKIDNKNQITNNCNSIKPKIEKNINEEHDNKNIVNDINNEIDDINNIIHSNFDLTKYIIQDDYNTTQLNEIIKTENNSDESDVDIETIQEIEIKPELKDIKNNKIIDYKNINLSFKSNCNSTNIISKIEDDVKNDPSWSPPKSKRKNNHQNNNKIKINEIQKKYQIKNKNDQITTKSLTINNKFNGKKLIFNNKIKNNKNLNHNSIGKLKQSSVVSSIPLSSSVIVERKVYGIGRGGKNISMCSRETSLSLTSSSSNCDPNKNEIVEKDNSSKNDTKKIDENKKQLKIEIKTEKNIKIKEEINDKKIDNTNKIEKEETSSLSSSSSQQPVEVNPIFISDHDYFDEKLSFPTHKNTQLPPVKKKLNLEEYKKRRGVSTAGGDVLNIAQNKIVKNVNNENLKSTITSKEENSINDFIQTQITTTKISNSSSFSSSTNKMKILEKLQKNPIDPITEAKNKVLRMKELKKKAALDRIIDSQVSAKVGPITKILPLEEIVKNSNNMKNIKNEEQYHKKINMNEYEEIIVVSVSLNTDLTIPPEFDRIKKMNSDGLINGNVNNTVVDGASLFYNISDTLQKANSIEISSSSLISSIQDIALKKLNTTTATTILSNSLPLQLSKTATIIGDKTIIQKQKSLLKSKNHKITNSNEEFTNATISAESEHGEDKIIMHLRKDRIRIPKQSQSVQTILLPQFPPLQLLLPSSDKLKSVNKIRRRKYRSRRSSSYSSNDDDDGKGNSSYHSSSPRSHHSTSSSRKRSRHNNYNNNDNDNIKINLEIIDDNRSRSKSKDSMLSTSSESGIGRRHRGRSRERRKRQRRYSSTSPTDSNSCSSSSNSSSESIRSRSRSLSRSSSSSSSVRSRSRSSSRSSYSRSRSNNQYQRNHRSRSRYKRHERNVSPAVEERRIVYVGRIEQETSKDDLKRKFLTYGPIRQITLHYKDTGMKYGFVTYEKAQDAFKAIDNGTRDPKISMYDISFGGRRKFCGATYSDLDGVSTSHLQMCSYPSIIQNSKEEKSDDSFEALLAQVKKKLINKKPLSSSSIRRDKI